MIAERILLSKNADTSMEVCHGPDGPCVEVLYENCSVDDAYTARLQMQPSSPDDFIALDQWLGETSIDEKGVMEICRDGEGIWRQAYPLTELNDTINTIAKYSLGGIGILTVLIWILAHFINPWGGFSNPFKGGPGGSGSPNGGNASKPGGKHINTAFSADPVPSAKKISTTEAILFALMGGALMIAGGLAASQSLSLSTAGSNTAMLGGTHMCYGDDDSGMQIY